MLEQKGTVIAASASSVWIEIRSNSACSGCSMTSCGTSVISRLFGIRPDRIEFENILGAHPGDRVVIGIPDEVLVRASLWGYFLPVCTMLLFALGAAASGSDQGIQVLAALAGLALGLILIASRKLSPRLSKPRLLRLETRSPINTKTSNPTLQTVSRTVGWISEAQSDTQRSVIERNPTPNTTH